MREIRQSGSVGGELQPNAASLPQSLFSGICQKGNAAVTLECSLVACAQP
jgi:hypothetical protein